jgi:hypothetical protein
MLPSATSSVAPASPRSIQAACSRPAAPSSTVVVMIISGANQVPCHSAGSSGTTSSPTGVGMYTASHPASTRAATAAASRGASRAAHPTTPKCMFIQV